MKSLSSKCHFGLILELNLIEFILSPRKQGLRRMLIGSKVLLCLSLVLVLCYEIIFMTLLLLDGSSFLILLDNLRWMDFNRGTWSKRLKWSITLVMHWCSHKIIILQCDCSHRGGIIYNSSSVYSSLHLSLSDFFWESWKIHKNIYTCQLKICLWSISHPYEG